MCEELLTSKTAWYSKQCVLTWKLKVSKSKRLLYQLQASVRPTKENESGLWATPNTMDPATIRLWRTPDAHCDRGPSSAKRMQMKVNKKMPISLNDQVAHPNIMWPTPTATERSGINPNTGKGAGLSKTVQMWPTPQARDWKGSSGRSYKGQEKDLPTAVRNKPGGSLNPTWVEWLMGYPGGYTDLKDWETLSSRKSQKK